MSFYVCSEQIKLTLTRSNKSWGSCIRSVVWKCVPASLTPPLWALCSTPDLSPGLTSVVLSLCLCFCGSNMQKNLLYIQSIEAFPTIADCLKCYVLRKVSPDPPSQASSFLTNLSPLFCGPFLHSALHMGSWHWPPTWLEDAWGKDISETSQSLPIASTYSWTSVSLVLNLPRTGGRVSVFGYFCFDLGIAGHLLLI